MTGILMTQVSTPIIGQAAWLLGKIMDGIYRVMDLIGIHNLGVCIILLTIVIYTLLMPLTIKQQKFSKMSAAMNPELQKVQQKYKGKMIRLPCRRCRKKHNWFMKIRSITDRRMLKHVYPVPNSLGNVLCNPQHPCLCWAG